MIGTIETRRDSGVMPPEPGTPRWPFVAVLIVAGIALGVAGMLIGWVLGDDTTTDSTTTTSSVSTTEPSDSTTGTGASTTTSGSTTETSGATSTAVTATTVATASTATTATTGVPGLEQPAIWPGPGVVFDNPRDAAADFVSEVLRVPPELGAFQQGDSRSGEIEVLPPAETAGSGPVRSVLLMRQLGPDDGWFVVAAVNGNNTITAPQSMSEVAAGAVTVSGAGRGFEGALVVEAFVAGDARRLDQQTAQGGSTEGTEPYSVTLDLSGANHGDTVLLLVRGGVGLETDPGEFSAIPVVIT